MRVGDVVYSPSFKNVRPNLQLGYKAPRGRTFVFLLLGEASKTDPDVFDAEKALRALGWIPKSEANHPRSR